MYDLKDLNYAITRLPGTVIAHKTTKKLVIVKKLYSSETLTGNKTPVKKPCIVLAGYDKKGSAVHDTLDDYSFNFPRIGWINFTINDDGRAIYLVRQPIRGGGYKQGLKDEQLLVINEGDTDYIRGRFLEYNLGLLEDALQGNFPSYETALSSLEEWADKRAISLDWAVDSKFKVLYRGDVVGKVNKKDKIALNQEKFYLKETLTECIGAENVEFQ